MLDALSLRMMIINQAQDINNHKESNAVKLSNKERQQSNIDNEPSSPSLIALKAKG